MNSKPLPKMRTRLAQSIVLGACDRYAVLYPISPEHSKMAAVILERLPGEIFGNAFRGYGYVYQQGVDYSYDTESDSDGSDSK